MVELITVLMVCNQFCVKEQFVIVGLSSGRMQTNNKIRATISDYNASRKIELLIPGIPLRSPVTASDWIVERVAPENHSVKSSAYYGSKTRLEEEQKSYNIVETDKKVL
jgi:hypothetical protein